jgi:hypothetical protein
MPALTLSLALLLLAWPALAVVGLLFHPIWTPLTGLLEKFAAPIAGALQGIEEGARDLQRHLRRGLRRSAKWFLYGDGAAPVPGWPWRCVVRPLLALAICVTLLLIELDLGALGWQVRFGTGAVPDLHLPLSLLLGMMLPLAGIAFAEAFFDVVDRHSVGPWSTFPAKARWVTAALVAVGLVAGVAANVFFFAWRFGQLGDGKNPYENLGTVMNFLLGALLYLAPVVVGALGVRFLAIVVPVFLMIACGILLAIEKAALFARKAIESVEAVGKILLTCLEKLGEQFAKLLDAGGEAASTAIKRIGDWHQRRREVKPPKPVRRRPALCFYLGRSILEATRAFWSLVHEVVHGVGGACIAIGSLIVAIVCGIGRGIRVAAIALAHAVRAVALAVARAATAVARAIRTCVVALAHGVVLTARVLGRTAVSLVRPIVLLVVAVAIWLFYWPSRIGYSFFGWLCRFDFWKNRMHFNPPTKPSPKKGMEWRLNRLADCDARASGIILRPFREEGSQPAVHG